MAVPSPSPDEQEVEVADEERGQVEQGEDDLAHGSGTRLGLERVGQQRAVVRELPEQPGHHQRRRGRRHRGHRHRRSSGTFPGGRTPGEQHHVHHREGGEQHDRIESRQHREAGEGAGGEVTTDERAVPEPLDGQQHRSEAHDQQRLQHRLEPAGGVAQEGHVGDQHEHRHQRERVVAQHSFREPPRHRDRRQEQHDADELGEQRSAPPEPLGHGHEQRPEEVRVPLDAFARVEHQAVSVGQVACVAEADERIVLDEAHRPGAQGGAEVHRGAHDTTMASVARSDRVRQPPQRCRRWWLERRGVGGPDVPSRGRVLASGRGSAKVTGRRRGPTESRPGRVLHVVTPSPDAPSGE